MNRVLWILILTLLLSGPLGAQRWTPAQKMGAAAALVMTATDCVTTQAALNRGWWS